MGQLALLQCIARAALRHAGNLAGFGLGDVIEQIWNDWKRQSEDAAHRAELEALVQMAVDEFRAQVKLVVNAVAAKEPPEVQRQLSDYLEQVPQLLRQTLHLPKQTEAHVTIHVTDGRPEEPIVCTEPTVLLFGRSKACRPRFDGAEHRTLSRHHCLVEINPPDVRLRDLGSLGGTYVTGSVRDADSPQFTEVERIKLGGRPRGAPPDPRYASRELELTNGTEVQLTGKGHVSFRVQVATPADARPATTCTWCQRNVTAERGANRPGLFVCGRCRDNMQGMMQEMLGTAEAGEPTLRPIRHYTLLRELGHGGMGAVYLARHQQSGEQVAIKLMLPHVAADERAVELFQREVRNTMALRHPNIVQLLDHGFARGTFFMVLEYCDGGRVDHLLAQRDGPLPPAEALDIARQTLAGLEYAHQAPIPFARQRGGGYTTGTGLVHRDLKPANLFLQGQGSRRVIKIGDYGLAKALDEIGLSGGTRTGVAAGTWLFMCRQQVIDYKRPQPAVDVWAMAATLYYLLTRQVPRDFPDGEDPWRVVLETKAVPIRKRNPRVPRRLAEVIDRALTDEPAIPFQSAAAFREALEAC